MLPCIYTVPSSTSMSRDGDVCTAHQASPFAVTLSQFASLLPYIKKGRYGGAYDVCTLL